MNNRYAISPVLNNVIFASAEYSFMFSVRSMVGKYQQKFQGMDAELFGKILWGDYYFDAETEIYEETTTRQQKTSIRRVHLGAYLQNILPHRRQG